jgi:D-alanine-D-alanine ligase
MERKRILLLAGGRSDEHRVSIVSARSLLEAYRAAPAGGALHFEVQVISRQGLWLDRQASLDALQRGEALQGGDKLLKNSMLHDGFDVVFPLLHGPQGEDGTVQGLLSLVGMPFVGSAVLASAVCMDKVLAKDVLAAAGMPQSPYALVKRSAFVEDPQRCVQMLLETFAATQPLPYFVKPANLGSSVGITKVEDPGGLHQALQTAFNFDRRAIVEKAIEQARELEVGILGNDAPQASVVGEITCSRKFYDYEAKYTPGHAQMHIPAEIPATVAAQVQRLALQAYGLLDCAGLARIDFFYQAHSQKLYINEINTMPGFTPLSMYPKMWEASGIAYPELIVKLVELAQQSR